MKIELHPHEFRREIYHLSVEDEFFREIHVSIFGRHPEFFFTEGSIEEQFFKREAACAKLFVLRRLSQKSYSTYELRKLLRERCVSDQAIDQVFDECVRLGYLDDHQWVRQFVQAQKLKKMGPKTIAAKLVQKGVPESLFLPCLENQLSKEEQLAGICRLIETRYQSRNFDDYRERQRVAAALARKGYPYELIQEAMLPYYS